MTDMSVGGALLEGLEGLSPDLKAVVVNCASHQTRIRFEVEDDVKDRVRRFLGMAVSRAA